jgi:sec-independent protein translocase protein TatA
MFGQFAFLDLGTPELIIILAIILLLFGGKRLPELSKSLGDSIRELRRGFGEDIHETKTETKKPAKKKTPAA